IGDGPNEMGSNVEPVDFGTGQTATAITVGEQHVCVVLATRAVKCWGGNFFGQLGLGDTNGRGDGFDELGDNLPVVALGTNRTATAVSAGLHHTARSSTTGP
ncbi:MAG TPA: hypothetical protein VD926_12755, partial [Acidimicrobiales bacterium]|nr:hypothetical protein [Acidimicrobiales bacterium]